MQVTKSPIRIYILEKEDSTLIKQSLFILLVIYSYPIIQESPLIFIIKPNLE